MRRRHFCLGLLWTQAGAANRAAPAVLSVGGRIAKGNDGDRFAFDMAALAALPQHEIATATPWHRGLRRFTGPLMRDVLAAAGAQRGETVRAAALNDYHADLPYDDVQRLDVIVARLLDGQPMAVRDKGPLFVMYPFDRHVELRNAVHYSRCVWQLKSLDVR